MAGFKDIVNVIKVVMKIMMKRSVNVSKMDAMPQKLDLSHSIGGQWG